jgi:hypothetical protein
VYTPNSIDFSFLGSGAYAPLPTSSSASSNHSFSGKSSSVLPHVISTDFSINAKQFAHRLVPAYLDKTDIVGIYSIASTHHWINLLSFWITSLSTSQKTPFFPLNVSKENLFYLRQILQGYAKTLQRHHTQRDVDEYRKVAKETLTEIQEGLKGGKPYYVPVGYAAGVNNMGHALTIKFRKIGKNIEAVILNLGEGLQMHPQVGWSASVELYHFQSFPVMIEENILFSEKGEEAFIRLILLMNHECPAQVTRYSAEDVYHVIYSLGIIQSSFDSKIADRTSKPQLGDICADMALVLLVKDVLIDLGLSKVEIQRLFCLEKFSDIFFFYKDLKSSQAQDPDLWTLLKNGTQEFSIRTLKSCNNALSEQEVISIYSWLTEIASETQTAITQTTKTSVASLRSDPIPEIPKTFPQINTSTSNFKLFVPIRYDATDIDAACRPSPPTPENVELTFKNWVSTAETLYASDGHLFAHSPEVRCFVSKAFSTLRIPSATHFDFWDQVPKEAINQILNDLKCLVILSAFPSNHDFPIYPQALILLTAYAIADKLVRRLYPSELKGFASPFYPSKYQLTHSKLLVDLGADFQCKQNYFEFKWLFLQRSNVQWVEIRQYFETIQTRSQYTLFALEEKKWDIEKGVKDLQRYWMEEHNPVVDHLKFLETFLQLVGPNSISLTEKFIKLWINEGARYYPRAISLLSIFAFYAWDVFERNLSHGAMRFHAFQIEGETIYTDGGRTQRASSIQCTLNETLFPESQHLTNPMSKYTENETQCLSLKNSGNPWNTSLWRQWTRIFADPTLQITSIIYWMRENKLLFAEKQFQELLQLGLFQPGLLARKIQDEPTTLTQLREVIKEGIAYFKVSSEHFHTCLFLVRLGLCIETYAPQRTPILNYYEELLVEWFQTKQNRYALSFHLLFLYQIALPQGRDSLKEAVKAHFWLAYDEENKDEPIPPWMRLETVSPLLFLQEELQNAFKDSAWCEQILQELWHLLWPETSLPFEPCVAAYPVLKQGNYELDILTRSLKFGSLTLFYLHRMIRHSLPDAFSSGLVWGENGEFYTPDGMMRITDSTKGVMTLARKFPNLQGWQDEWFTKANINPGSLSNDHPLITSFDHWHCGSKLTVFTPVNGDRPLYLIKPGDEVEESCIIKIGSGKSEDLQLLNIWTQNHPLASWFERLGALWEVCVWIHPHTKTLEEFEFLHLTVSFKREGEKFRCLTFPEFELAREQTIEELGNFKGALVLENKRRKAVILPAARALKASSDDFSTEVHTESAYAYFDICSMKHYYQVDPFTGALISPNAEATLRLILLFALQRNYVKALYYLHQLHPFHYVAERAYFSGYYKAITELKDGQPDALAFYLHFALHIIRNRQQVLLEGYYPGLESLLPLFEWAAQKLAKYLRILSTHEVNRISAYIRLSKEEELFLQYTLKDPLKSKDCKQRESSVDHQPSWKKTFDIRHALLQTGKWSTITTTTMYDLTPLPLSPEWLESFSIINHAPIEFSPSEIPLKPFVRLSHFGNYIQKHFISLYKKTREGKFDLDIFFLFRTCPSRSIVFFYVLILRYVQKYPQSFKGLDFGKDPAKNREVMEQIVKKAGGALAKMWQFAGEITQFFRNYLVIFHYQKSVSLALPPPQPLQPCPWHFEPSTLQALKKLHQGVETYFLTHYLGCTSQAIFPTGTSFAFNLSFGLSSSDSEDFTQQILGFSVEVNGQGPFTRQKNTRNASKVPEAEGEKPKTQVFSALALNRATPTVKQLILSLQEGHARLIDPKYGKMSYTLKDGKTKEECEQQALNHLNEKREALKICKRTAEERANQYPNTDYRIGLRKIGKDLPQITLEGILTRSYLTQNINLIKQANPSLPPRALVEVVTLTIMYHILRIQIQQLEQAITALQTGSVQAFGECIAIHGTFDPTAEPEIFLYQSITGKSLNPNQGGLLQWEMQTTSTHKSSPPHSQVRMFAAPAGIGKTTLYTPIAMKRLQRLGYTPFTISSKALYHVDREGLNLVSSHVFSFGIDVLELTLNTQAKASHFKWFYEQLKQRHQRSGFKLTPDVYYAIDLKYQLALETKNIDEVGWLWHILTFFKQKGAVLIDECRQNCSPFTQAKIGIGKPISLPPLDRHVFLQIYRALMSSTLKIADGRTVESVIRLKDNLQATTSEEEREEVKKSVLHFLISDMSWVKSDTPEDKSRAIKLVHIYFNEFFFSAMSLIWRMNHVHSIREDEDIHVPAHTKQATRSYFEEVYLTLIATIQGHFQEGLTPQQSKNLFMEIESAHIKEVGPSGHTSQIESQLGVWVNNPHLRLSNFSAGQQESMNQFHNLVKHNNETIFWFLERIALKKIQYSPEQLTVTPIHLLNAFNQVTLFSADPGPEEIYGIYESGLHVRHDPQFLAHAAHQSLKQENSRLMMFPFFATAEDFFNHLIQKDPLLFTHLRLICDAGGMLRNFTVMELVTAFFKMLEKHPHIAFDGIISFEESSDKEEETRLFLWLAKNQKSIELQGHDIPAALRSLGYNWEKMKLLTLIDPSHRAGANIEQPKDTSLLVLMGERLTLADSIQGTLRGRGVLKNEQCIIWGITHKLAQVAIVDSAQKILNWELHNEGEVIDKQMLLSAIQQIDYCIEERIRFALLSKSDPVAQIEVWHRYRTGFVKKTIIDPIVRFEGVKNLNSTENLLWKYAQEKYNTFQFEEAWQEAKWLHTKLQPIIAALKKRKPQLLTLSGVNHNQHATVHTYQRQEMKKEYVTDAHYDLAPENFILLPNGFSLGSSQFTRQLIEHSRTAQSVFGSSHLTQGLYFTQNALRTAITGNTSLNETYLKPALYLLAVYTNQRYLAFALMNAEASVFQKQLLSIPIQGCQIALLTADGSLAQNGRGPAQFTQAMLQHPFIQDVVIDVGLTCCTLMHPSRFIQRIPTWDDFWPMWENIKSWQPLPHLAHIQAVEKLVPASLKKTVVKQDNSSFSLGSFLNKMFNSEKKG